MAIDMFCGKRHEEESSNKGLQLLLRIAAYYAASPKVAPGEEREGSHCKQRWHKINDLVSKFSGAYEAATREKTSSQNETDVLKHAHEIYYNNYKKKFTLEHAWKELRNDQKWCANESSNKRRKFDDGSYSASESVKENDSAVDDDGTTRPPGVKAAKARGKKKPVGEGKEFYEFQTMWSIKKVDLDTKERLGKMKLLDSLIAKRGALASLVSFKRVALASLGLFVVVLYHGHD
ncbi:PREDICTED: glutathione S-transferase T3-like [Brassica oleracea var. oleracea]|uniref:glutathione S-transferase T3-like n=1 Tax=Brassica oleracea var. oleracea TaxID=109376 RepID=UPI0006A70300|nr:PREDICTED: glutathione S-transferase T3-like [Brassica oleracea var. oleracea]